MIKKYKRSLLIILMGLMSLSGIIWSADEPNIAFDQKTDAIKVLAFGRPVLPTGAGPTVIDPADIIEPALDPRGDVGISPSVAVGPVNGFGLPGDYNFDGGINAADYVVWRKTLGQSGPSLPADGNSDGAVNNPDHDIWKNNFGNT